MIQTSGLDLFGGLFRVGGWIVLRRIGVQVAGFRVGLSWGGYCSFLGGGVLVECVDDFSWH